MTSTTTSSPIAGQKRAYQDEAVDDGLSNEAASGSTPPQAASAATSAFRNVSACNRCRQRKNRCDARLPSCTTCEKANARCIGYDPITKREIPRSYVYFLETRLDYFESLLKKNNISYEVDAVYNADSQVLPESTGASQSSVPDSKRSVAERRNGTLKAASDEKDKIERLVSNIGMVSVQGASDSRFLGSVSGISFARVVLSAVKSSVSGSSSERTSKAPRGNTNSSAGSSMGSSMRDTYFGLATKPAFKEAPFPDRPLADKLVNLYFEYANPQIPILHRGEFENMLQHAYSVEPTMRSSRELYLLNIVFAVGAGVIWGSSDQQHSDGLSRHESATKRAKLSSQQAQPEEYHASAIVHLGVFLSSAPTETAERSGGDLEELQAVLLLAAFALLRPVAPGLWYIVGVAMRLAVDLGLHYEDGSDIEEMQQKSDDVLSSREKGRRQWTRDFRRRLWWCTYNMDRLVSTCVGRPFGITDQVVTTAFPSLLEDKYISRTGGLQTVVSFEEPSYKRVAHHYLKLRLLQSEILQVLQYQQAQQVRHKRRRFQDEPVDTSILSPYLSQHSSFRSWRQNIDQRLYEWKESAPSQVSTGVSFDRKFLELNYWQAVIMLYRQSLAVPAAFANEMSPTEEVSSPGGTLLEEKEDEDVIFLKCAEAGQNTLKLYRQLHRQRLVNYTYLATHHLFMAGISFLYAVWHSPAVRNRLTLDSFDFTVLAATSVLGDLMEKCPPAEACRDAFERMSKATVQMCLSTPGFGFSKDGSARTSVKREPSFSEPLLMEGLARTISGKEYAPIAPKPVIAKRPPPKFDMDLRQLFPEEIDVGPRPSAAVPKKSKQRGTDFTRSQAPLANSTSTEWRQAASLPQAAMAQNSVPNVSPTFSSRQAPVPSPSLSEPSFQPEQNYDIMNYSVTSSSALPEDLDYMNNSYDFTAINDQGSPLGALDLGFGPGVMGFDYSHDWSDGQQYDLFDGFFFGNNAGGNGDYMSGPSDLG
ncbi:Positive regulator of purine utilization [Cyphellophora attinorum]|uniref:Positive regulator of purine utilization n=1 Tax=Cyphellophora attinorum TaxID=1664694 RepID=A0A0N1H3D0_9EURO|nr:Positive regulator of purine utilization [Phialophora attinorum]KPI34890.1 Positive regulator of purine utilization [Phialophora attinorum]